MISTKLGIVVFHIFFFNEMYFVTELNCSWDDGKFLKFNVKEDLRGKTVREHLLGY